MPRTDADACDARAECSCPEIKKKMSTPDHFKVELSTPGPIQKNETFGMTVTAMKGKRSSQVASSTADSITLYDGKEFSSTGSGVIVTSTTMTKFTWTGKSGDNTLTGTGNLGITGSPQVIAMPGVDTAYSGTAYITGVLEGTRVSLADSLITGGDWSGGVATVPAQKVTSDLYGVTGTLNIVVAEEGAPSAGRYGAAKISLDAAKKFIINAPTTVERGTPFEITIQTYDSLTGDTYSYTPAGNISCTVTSQSDPSDNWSPSYINNTGWVDGKRTASCNISGGTGSDRLTVRIYDSDTGIEGSFTIATDSELITLTYYQLFFAGTVNDIAESYKEDDEWYYDPYDWEANAAMRFAILQHDLYDAFAQDTHLSVVSNAPAASYGLSERYNYFSASATLLGGYTSYNISEEIRESLLSANFQIGLSARLYWETEYNNGYIWAPNASSFSLGIKFTDTPNLYSSGAELLEFSPDIVVEITELINRSKAAGNVISDQSERFNLPFNKSLITSLSNSTVYVWWLIIQKRKFPYLSYFRATGPDKEPTYYPRATLYIGIERPYLELII